VIKSRQVFGGLIYMGNFVYTNGNSCHFGLKNAFAKFQKVIDKVLVGLTFVKCYINDIIILI
jgi:hypothetical protein